jgi:threonine dehydrogenase-like Zn-dependent dehydrogenase
MQAITVVPGDPDSASLSQVEEPSPAADELLVETLRLGVCGTDREIVDGVHGEPPPGRDQLILGHELLGRVREAAAGPGFEAGDLVAGIVRRPDPVPCACCARGEWDMCRNGRYTERGIKGRDGYGAELVALERDFAIRVDPALGELGVLTEPASVVAKAWEQIERISSRGCAAHRRALITGAGPIGLLGTLMSVQRGMETHVLDRAEDGIKPELVEALGASYHTGSLEELCREAEPDIVVECTGAAQLVFDAMRFTAPGAISCLTGVAPQRSLTVDVGALNNEIVLENDVVFGSVNANHRHFEQAARALQLADRDWLAQLVTREVPLDRWSDALEKGDEDIKVVVDFGEVGS